MRNHFNKLRWKNLVPTIFLNLYTKSPLNSRSENSWRNRDLRLILNLDI